jgi:VanZ family protein
VATTAALSLTPADTVARTGFGGHVEHVVAYAGTTFLAAAAYGGWMRVATSMLAYAGVLEFLQHFSPGRTPSVVDYLFSSVGIVAGLAAAALLHRCLVAPKRA